MTGRRVTVVGVHVGDVLGRPIEILPRGQQSQLIDQIRVIVAGTAGGTAVDLARLGADVAAVGAIGEDLLGELLETSMQREGIDTRLARKPGVQTSATILPIHPDGSRPAWHVPGANRELGFEDVPSELLASSSVLHYGGFTALPRLDGAPAARLLDRARAAGALTTADCLGIKRPDAAELLAEFLPRVDIFMPNRQEAQTLTGIADVGAAARRLHELGASTVIVTCDVDGCLIFDSDGARARPAFRGTVVDSSGCGDAFAAGTIVGHLSGWNIDAAAELGLAAAALTLAGLGSDAGLRSLEHTLEWMKASERSQKIPEIG